MSSSWFEFLKTDFVQGFPAYCGFCVLKVGHGTFETSLTVSDHHCQQDGFVHAGVMATMADHTAGYAAYTTVSKEFRILTIEFKINYFKPATGPILSCRSKVINNGKKVKVAEADVISIANGVEKLVSKGIFTQMAVPAHHLKSDI